MRLMLIRAALLLANASSLFLSPASLSPRLTPRDTGMPFASNVRVACSSDTSKGAKSPPDATPSADALGVFSAPTSSSKAKSSLSSLFSSSSSSMSSSSSSSFSSSSTLWRDGVDAEATADPLDIAPDGCMTAKVGMSFSSFTLAGATRPFVEAVGAGPYCVSKLICNGAEVCSPPGIASKKFPNAVGDGSAASRSTRPRGV
mmetsp:Transcript_12119/g.32612  ORF Transcript_12119/g.32612 Transcript_12119/m.32612 type:complete len:202 (-) Transcript_12119:414-1019(-)